MNKDIQFQIECLSKEVVVMLMEKYGWDIKRSLDELYSSAFMWFGVWSSLSGAVYLFDYLQEEIEIGKLS